MELEDLVRLGQSGSCFGGSDTTGWRDLGASGSTAFGWGLRGSGRVVSGTRDVPDLTSAVDEDQERGALFADGRRGTFAWGIDGAWNRASTSENGVWQRPDWRGSLSWGDSLRLSLGASREVVFPVEETQRPDPTLRTRPSSGLSPETRDLFEVRARTPLPSSFRLEGGAAFQLTEDALQSEVAPIAGAGPTSRQRAFSLENAGSTVGWSGELGLGWVGDRWHARTLWSSGWTGLPGEGFSRRDPRLPQWQSRSTLGWKRALLDGRLQLGFDADLKVWGESWAWTSSSVDTAAHPVRLEPSSQLDLEMQVGIRSFWIDWWIENLLDERQSPAPGWTPPGVRAGWGITWNFGG